MTFIKIICPKCSAEAKLSLVDTDYTGPRRCWKCHEYFTISIHNNQLTSCEPLSAEEYERQQAEKKAKEKAQQGGFNFSTSEEPPARQSPPPARQEFFRPPMPKETPRAPQPEKPTTDGIYPPIRPSTFIPVENPDNIPERPKKPKDKDKQPPDRFNIFIPPQT